MQEIIIFGHKKPDTDSVCAAITLSYLKRQLGYKTSPRVIGDINKESRFVLKYFKVKAPQYQNDVKNKVKHTAYQKNMIASHQASILDCYNYMIEHNVRTLPVVDDNKTFKGLISMKDITQILINGQNKNLDSNYTDICQAINASEILRYNEEVTGIILTASYDLHKILEERVLTKDTILIVGNREDVIISALKIGIKMLVLTGGVTLNKKCMNLAIKNKINVVQTNLDTYVTSNRLFLSNQIDNYVNTANVVSVNNNMYIEDFINLSEREKYKNYPVIDKNNQCLGLISRIHILDVVKKDVILVDHNEFSQSIDGIKEANIIEVVDHHNIGSIATASPIIFRTMPYGCTNTIIYGMYLEYNIEIPYEMAGLMYSAIVSDTLNFKSPTTTSYDIKAADELLKILQFDENKYIDEMFKAGTSLDKMSIEEIVNMDYKEFEIKEEKVGIGQVMSMDIDSIMKNKDAYINYLNEYSKSSDSILSALFITDVIKECSYLLYNEAGQSILKRSFKLLEIYQGIKLDGIISRKKQIVPNIIYILDK